jgi:DNA-binding transcriptional LysR family regulator
MELRRLRLLFELSRRGTIAAVADALAYSPSAVSVSLAELEREVGSKLLRRAGRNVQLTPAGWRLAAYAEEALAAEEAVLGELASLSDAPVGRVRLTFVQTPALALLPGTLSRLHQSAPGLQVEVIHRETAPALDDLRSRAVDMVVGIEYEPLPVARHHDIYREDLVHEQVLVCLPHGHPAAEADGTVALRQLEHMVWAAGHPGTGHSAFVDNVCNRLGGYGPEVRHRSDDALILSALVASGRAITFLPALFANSMPQLEARPICEGPLHRLIFTATRTASSQAPMIVTVRDALRASAYAVAADHPLADVLPPK